MKEAHFQILKSLIQIPSPTGREKDLADFIVDKYLTEGWVVERDVMHNILFRPDDDNKTEKLPLLYAHQDTHPRSQPPDASLKHDDIIWLNEAGQVAKRNNIDIQMGFDDKASVAAILYLMKHTKLKFRALFVVQEETGDRKHMYDRYGGVGIEYALKSSFTWVFEKSAYVLSLDRANGLDLIDEYGVEGDGERPRMRMCSEEFKDWVIKFSSNVNHKLKIANGRIADIYNIKYAFHDLDCVNLSIGYYNEHKSEESLEIDETLGVIRVVVECLSQS